MAVITQNYDIDLRATGEFPVVKMSQFDTGSRTIVFTVYDGHDLAHIDGMVARVDGTRSDGVEFSSTCTVSAGSKVSFTITQEMTKSAGKHPAELVIFDAQGNPIGTQNFIVEVEAAPMVRDAAVSADDRTLYDQYTQSLEEKFDAFKAGISDTIYSINELIGASSKPITIYDENVQLNGVDTIHVRLTYDPLTALVCAHVNGSLSLSTRNDAEYSLCIIDNKYCPNKDFFTYDATDGPGSYYLSADNTGGASVDTPQQGDYQIFYLREKGSVYTLRFTRNMLPDQPRFYKLSLNAVWYARGGKFIGVTPVSGKRYSFGNGLTVNANGVVSVKAGKNLGFSRDGTLNAAGGSGNAGLITAGTATANGVAVEYYTVHKDA